MHRPADDFGDELDVFDARQYFSGRIDDFGLDIKTNSPIAIKDEVTMRPPMEMETTHKKKTEMQNRKKEKKWKQPSLAGGRVVATLLNSLFLHASSKKKQQLKSVSSAKSYTEPKLSCSSVETESMSGFSTHSPLRYAPRELYYFTKSGPHSFCLEDGQDHTDKLMTDKRLQGIRVVRGGSVAWVVAIGDQFCARSRVWEEEKPVSEKQQQEDDGWGSETSSDLFELEDLSVHEW